MQHNLHNLQNIIANSLQNQGSSRTSNNRRRCFKEQGKYYVIHSKLISEVFGEVLKLGNEVPKYDGHLKPLNPTSLDFSCSKVI
jgi:hypothetical protein